MLSIRHYLSYFFIPSAGQNILNMANQWENPEIKKQLKISVLYTRNMS